MGAKPAKAISMDFMKTFGAYLRWKLAQHGMTQRSMAESLGICWRYFSRLVRGEHQPSREMASNIGEGLDDPAAALLAAGYLPFPGYELRRNYQPKKDPTLTLFFNHESP